MKKFIIIIHSSEIIRKGLAAILRSFFNADILQLTSIHEMHAYREIKQHSLIFLVQNASKNDLAYIHPLGKKNQVKVISIENPSTEKALPEKELSSIHLDTPALEIQNIIATFWQPGEKSSRPAESDELTLREREVLQLVAMGFSNKQIADKLFISIHTVISHRKNISEKTGIKSISGLTVYAILNNLIDTATLNPEDLI